LRGEIVAHADRKRSGMKASRRKMMDSGNENMAAEIIALKGADALILFDSF